MRYTPPKEQKKPRPRVQIQFRKLASKDLLTIEAKTKNIRCDFDQKPKWGMFSLLRRGHREEALARHFHRPHKNGVYTHIHGWMMPKHTLANDRIAPSPLVFQSTHNQTANRSLAMAINTKADEQLSAAVASRHVLYLLPILFASLSVVIECLPSYLLASSPSWPDVNQAFLPIVVISSH
jgi:hypothetical protein